ncbi:hypothetical protein [Bartonella quintana]|uniref:hypothetical protein n=1 Tax=Bartonella quintana TaxID=803 RepID=UPI0002F15B14|nr:hypothetical protein [Bartonella quintana]
MDITEEGNLFDDYIMEKSHDDHDSNSGFLDCCLQIKAKSLFSFACMREVKDFIGFLF